MREVGNVVQEAYDRLTVFDLWGEAPFASQAAYPERDGVFINPFKPTVNKSGSFEIKFGGKGWVDYAASPKLTGGIKKFLQRCHPTWSDAQVREYVVSKAGLTWTGGSAWTPAEKRAYRKKMEREEAQAREKAWADRERLYEFPERAKTPAEWPGFVADRFEEGRARLSEDVKGQEKFAASRHWPVEWVAELVRSGYIAAAWHPNRGPSSPKRRGVTNYGLAWRVEVPVWRGLRCESLRSIGYHQRYWVARDKSFGWRFIPNSKVKARPSEFEKQMADYCESAGIEPGEVVVPGVPVVFGNLDTASVAIVTEGQWDAATIWGALGGLTGGCALPVVVFGLRGVSGVDNWLAFYGDWLKWRTPRVWLFPDNDAAGRKWTEAVKRKHALPTVTLVDRLVRAGLKVQASRVQPQYGKDFNDYYKHKPLGPEEMQLWMSKLGLM